MHTRCIWHQTVSVPWELSCRNDRSLPLGHQPLQGRSKEIWFVGSISCRRSFLLLLSCVSYLRRSRAFLSSKDKYKITDKAAHYFRCCYLCLSVFICGFVRRLFSQLLKDRAHGRRQRAIRREPQIILVSHNCFFVLSGFLVSCAQQLVDDRFGIRELIDRDLIFARGQFVLTLVFIDAAQPDVRFRLEAVAFADGAIERTNRFVGLPGLAIDAAFGGGRLGIDGLVTPRIFDLSQRAV